MARILVTGATGFVGSYLFKLLQDDGHEVFGTTRSRPNGSIAYCNIEDPAAVAALFAVTNPDIVVHCAAISSVTSSTNYEYYLSNTVGTENLVRSAASAGGNIRFVFVSTAGVYGNQDTDCLSEGLCPKPVHHYGMSKFCGERVVCNFADEIAFTIVRPFNIIGEGQSPDFIVPKLSRAFAARQPSIRLGNIDVYRDYIDIQEAVSMIRHMIFDSRAIGEIYNLCSGNAVSLKELIAIFEEITGHQLDIEVAPEFVRKNEVWRLTGDATKLKALVNGAVEAVPIERSLRRIVASQEAAIR